MTTPPQTPLTLYRTSISGHCHRVELLLSLLNLPVERVEVNVLAGEHRQPAHLARNPLGQVPVLVDGGTVLADSNGILVYLVQRYAPGSHWMPQDPAGQAALQRWFSLAAGMLAPGPASARFAALVGREPTEAAQALGRRLFDFMEAELAGRDWLLGGPQPTLADIALVSYTAQAPIGGISLAPYPHIAAWVARMEALPGYVPLAHSLPDIAPAAAA